MKPYEKYVPSGLEWIGDIPEGWSVEKFRYFFSTTTGLTITKSELVDEGIPCINYGEIHSKYGFDLDINRDELRNAPFELLETQRSAIVEEQDFVFCDTSEDIDGSGNNTLICNLSHEKLFAGSHTIIVHPLAKIYARYFAFLFSTIEWRSQIRKNVTGVKVFSITQGLLKSTKLIFPPLEVQKNIAYYLDIETERIDNIIKAKGTLITRLKERRTVLIFHAVTKGIDPNAKMKPSGVEWIGDIPEGWEVKKIKYMFSVYNGATPKSDNDDFWNGEIMWITPADYSTADKYILESNRKITYEGLNSCATRIVPPGSIIISNRAPIGTVAIAAKPLTSNQGCKSLVKKIDVDERFVYYFLSTQEANLNSLGKGTTFLELSNRDLAGFTMPHPEQQVQNNIADYLDCETAKIDDIIDKTALSIVKLKEYRTSLISACVTGRIDVRSV